MSWSCNCSLTTVLDIHVIMVITVSVAFKSPTVTILKLLRNLPPWPVLRHPWEWWGAITSIKLKGKECWPCAESCCCKSLPESNPFENSLILIDNFSLFEVEGWVWVHWWSLYEWLKLIARMCGSSFKSKNFLDWFFSEMWVSKSIGYMGEFLVLSPLNIMLRAFIMVVMVSCWSIL